MTPLGPAQVTRRRGIATVILAATGVMLSAAIVVSVLYAVISAVAW